MRKTIAELNSGVYSYDDHGDLSDHSARRYHLFSFDFDSTASFLALPEDSWDEEMKINHVRTRNQLIDRLKIEHGTGNIETIVENLSELGPKLMSVISHHNYLHEQARRSFLIGAYYPALVAACTLGERILNHLILDLRDNFKGSPHYKTIFRKKSFDDWKLMVQILIDWKVLANGVGERFLLLGDLRHKAVHFNQTTYQTLREDALKALQQLNEIIAKQFGYFGAQPWFLENTPGAQFIKRNYENHPFVRFYLVPKCGFVGHLFGVEPTSQGNWHHLDYVDYGDKESNDEEFAKLFRERDHAKIISREMIIRLTNASN